MSFFTGTYVSPGGTPLQGRVPLSYQRYTGQGGQIIYDGSNVLVVTEQLSASDLTVFIQMEKIAARDVYVCILQACINDIILDFSPGSVISSDLGYASTYSIPAIDTPACLHIAHVSPGLAMVCQTNPSASIAPGDQNQVLITDGGAAVWSDDVTINDTLNVLGNLQFNGTSGTTNQVLRKTSATTQAWGPVLPASLQPGTSRQVLETNTGATAAQWTSSISLPGTIRAVGNIDTTTGNIIAQTGDFIANSGDLSVTGEAYAGTGLATDGYISLDSGDQGTAGQVITSAGAGSPAVWSDPSALFGTVVGYRVLLTDPVTLIPQWTQAAQMCAFSYNVPQTISDSIYMEFPDVDFDGFTFFGWTADTTSSFSSLLSAYYTITVQFDYDNPDCLIAVVLYKGSVGVQSKLTNYVPGLTTQQQSFSMTWYGLYNAAESIRVRTFLVAGTPPCNTLGNSSSTALPSAKLIFQRF